MKFLNYSINADIDTVKSFIFDNEKSVIGVQTNEKRGKPRMHVRLKNERIRMNCEYTGKATRDNDFIGGTHLFGKFFERDGKTFLRGIVVTAPLFHIAMAVLFAYFVYRCIMLGAISIVPICIVVFSVVMFWEEYSKQKVIKQYVYNAFKLTYKNISGKK